MRSCTSFLVAFPVLAALTGCALTSSEIPVAGNPASSAMHGTVYGGQQPVTGSTITLYAVGTSGYGKGATSLATTTSDAHGNWSIASYTCPYSNTPTYLIASGGIAGTSNNANIAEFAGTGPCNGLTNLNVTINEVSTVAGAFAMSHFFPTAVGGAVSTDLVGGTAAGSGVYQPGLVIADNQTVNMLTNIGNGTAAVTSTANGITTTLESAKLNNLANIIAACVNSNGQTSTTETTSYCGQLFAATTPPGSATRPLDTLQAAVQIALRPYQNVTTLYNLPPATSPFVGLGAAPNDWTLGVSFTSPNYGLQIAGTPTYTTTSTIDIDASGNIWFPSNSSSSHGAAYFSPSTGSFNGPYATSLYIPQYVAIDGSGTAYVSDEANFQFAIIPTTNPSNSTIQSAGGAAGYISALSTGPSTSYGSGVANVVNGTSMFDYVNSTPLQTAATLSANASGLVAIDVETNGVTAYVASGDSTVACTLSKNQTNTNQITYATTSSNCTSAGITYTAGSKDVVMAASTLNQLCSLNAGSCFAAPGPINAPQAIATDGDGALWFANSGNASISTMGYKYSAGTSADYSQTSPVAYIHNSSNGNTLVTPFGLAIDNAGNVWISNAGCISTASGNGGTCAPGSFTLSEIIGAAAPTRTPLSNQAINNTVGSRP